MTDNAVDIDLHHLIPFGKPTSLPKKVIIIHTTENTLGTPAKNIVDYQVRTRSGSYHRLVDSTGKITLANTDDWQVWATGNKGNDMALHVSVVWQAKTTRAEWLAQPQVLDGVARVIAHWSKKYGIPLVKLSRAELGAGKHGVAGHLEAQVWGNTDHWDPGYHFPYDVVLEKANQINNPSTKPDGTPINPGTPSPSIPQGDSMFGPEQVGALHEAKVAAQDALGVLEARYQSIINPQHSFTLPEYAVLIDAATWEQRKLSEAIAKKLGLDPDTIIEEAIKTDRGEK